MLRLAELFDSPYLYWSRLGLILSKPVKLKALFMIQLNSIQTVLPKLPAPNLEGGQNNLESILKEVELFYSPYLY